MTPPLKLYAGNSVVEVVKNGHPSEMHALADEIGRIDGDPSWSFTPTSASVREFVLNLDLMIGAGKAEMTAALLKNFREFAGVSDIANIVCGMSHGAQLILLQATLPSGAAI